jgi:hypothetical protein
VFLIFLDNVVRIGGSIKGEAGKDQAPQHAQSAENPMPCRAGRCPVDSSGSDGAMPKCRRSARDTHRSGQPEIADVAKVPIGVTVVFPNFAIPARFGVGVKRARRLDCSRPEADIEHEICDG